nr:hypothetical protein [Actinomycetota bacterium]
AQPPAPEPAPAPKPEPNPKPEPDDPVDDGGDTQRILASDKQKKSQENLAPPPPEKPEARPAPVQKVEPPTEKPAAKPAAEEPEPVVREAPAEPAPEPTPEPAPPVAKQEAPLPQEPVRELVFQDDEELEARFRQSAQAAAPPAPEDECIPARSDTNSPGDEGEGGPAMAMMDGVLSAMRSVLEGLGLVSAAEAEQGAASPAPCAETAEIAGES